MQAVVHTLLQAKENALPPTYVLYFQLIQSTDVGDKAERI